MKHLNTIKNQFASLFSKTDKIKMIPVDSLRIDEEYQSLYQQESEKVNRIAENMKANGYDLSQPIIILSDNTIIDGHSRYLAARQVEIKKVPVICKDINERTEVLSYMEHLQLDRRNLTEAEVIMHFENLMRLKSQAKSEGKSIADFSDEAVAKQLNISPRQVQKIREVEKKATPEQLGELREGTKSINQIHSEIKSSASAEGKSDKLQHRKIEKESQKNSINLSSTTLNLLREFANEHEKSHSAGCTEEVRKDAFNKMNRDAYEVCTTLCKQMGFISENE